MLFGLHLFAGKDLFNDAFFVDDKGGADGAHGLFAIHRFLAPCAHRLQKCVVDIGNQGEW